MCIRDRPESGQQKPSYFWTWRLLADGYGLEHIVQIRQLTEEVIHDHAIQAAENNLPVQQDWLLGSADIGRLEAFASENPEIEQIKLISKLPKGISAQQFIYYNKCRKQVGSQIGSA